MMNETIPNSIDLLKLDANVSNSALHANNNFKASLLSVKAEHELKSHTSPTDAFLYVLEGEATFTLEGQDHPLKIGDYFSFKANEAHSLVARTDFRMILVR